jgi:hypothetical protein
MTGIIHSLLYGTLAESAGLNGAVIAKNTPNVNIRAILIANGWNGVAAITTSVTINAGVIVYSTSTDTPALDTGGPYPVGSVITLINKGTILGAGGAGGNSNNKPGLHGGLALNASAAVTIDNTGGIIAGGGGGGGASYDTIASDGFNIYGGSSGGGGIGGGAAGIYVRINPSPGIPVAFAGANLGTAGTLLAAGAGGAVKNSAWASAGGGGGGGGFAGTGGTAGTTVQQRPINGGFTTDTYPGAVGGAGGGCITGNNLITWTAFGTRYGTVVGVPLGVFTVTLASNESNVVLRAKLITLGWSGVIPVTVTVNINAGVVISSINTGSYALDTGAVFPVGSVVTINNAGSILGHGGAGGNNASSANGGAGGGGGGALHVQTAITVNNTGGIVAGGGGGGGAGGGIYGLDATGYPTVYAGGSGGGGAGALPGAPGRHTTYPYSETDLSGPFGATGTGTTGGAGGASAHSAGAGGAGGTPGVAGTAGTMSGVAPNGMRSAGGNGGAAGNCTLGNTLITWSAVGTRLGALN